MTVEFEKEQNEIQHSNVMVRPDKTIREAGYTKTQVLEFKPETLHGYKEKIKARDMYFIFSPTQIISLSLADYYSYGFFNCLIIDTTSWTKQNIKTFIPTPKGRLKAPNSPIDGTWSYTTASKFIHFDVAKNKRVLRFYKYNYKKIRGKKEDLNIQINIDNHPNFSICNLTPFKDNRQIIYQNMTLGYHADGHIAFSNQQIDFSKNDTVAIMQWLRGNPPKSFHQLSVFFSYKDGKGNSIDLNLGITNADETRGNENAVIFNNEFDKLDIVTFKSAASYNENNFKLNNKNIMTDWEISTNDNKITLTFTPRLYDVNKISSLCGCNATYKIFGFFSGTYNYGDGKSYKFDNVIGTMLIDKAHI